MLNKNLRWLPTVLFSCLILTGCTGIPDNITPVKSFELNKYLGSWHEIARLPHRFEKDLIRVTAKYSLSEDGNLTVINQGFNPCKQQRDKAQGRAKFAGDSNTAYLQVSFFGPFYGAYVVFELGPVVNEKYQYAFVAGPTTDYLWLLSRTPDVSAKIKQHFIDTARQAGFDTDKLIWAEQFPACQ